MKMQIERLKTTSVLLSHNLYFSEVTIATTNYGCNQEVVN